ncbi:MAG: type II toxin-antitoxin system HicA family toxin [Pseudomonadales bacterium]|nr:type II toxin-antitoxin system HicA family toxin [Pseudomonadales bacterium]
MVGKKHRNVLASVLGGRSDANVPFSDLIALLKALGFSERIKGDHHILWKDDVVEIVNLQPKGSKAKPYQVKQVRNILLRYKMGFDDE